MTIMRLNRGLLLLINTQMDICVFYVQTILDKIVDTFHKSHSQEHSNVFPLPPPPYTMLLKVGNAGKRMQGL